MKKVLASPLASVFTKTEIKDVRFVRPDVAIVNYIKHVSDQPDASLSDNAGASLPSQGSLAYVVVKEQDRWLIASAQTTPIKTFEL